MRPRSTPLRLTGTLIVVFFVFTLAGYGGAYLVTRAALERDIAARLAATVDALRSIAEPDETVERATEIAAAAKPRDLLMRFTFPGTHPIGNLPPGLAVADGAIVAGAGLAGVPEAADSYLAWDGPVGSGHLTLLVGRESLDELTETYSKVLLLSLVPALLVATLAGALVARRAQARVEAIRTTLAALTSGNTAARVPLDDGPADDLGEIAHAVNRMAAAQEASIEALRQVSADIAHDLKTPIQRVAVLLERLEATVPGEPAREIVATARQETAEIVETFRGLLQIAQLESGQARGGFADVDLAALVADIVDVYAPAAEETGHHLSATVDPRAIVHGDRNLLGRLVANLVENALRHTPAGRVTLAVRHDGAVVLSVRDEGPGIPAGEREKVLRRLYRLERSRTSEGSGLGLSLAAAIANLHGATLTLGDARPGLVVTVAFPPPGAAPA